MSKGMKEDPFYEWIIPLAEKRMILRAKTAARKRRLAMFERRDREYAALGVRETVRVANGVKTVSRGTCGGGSRAGCFGNYQNEILGGWR